MIKIIIKYIPASEQSYFVKKILSYASLIRDGDTEEFQRNRFAEDYVSNFMFLMMTSKEDPSPHLLDRMYPVRVNP